MAYVFYLTFVNKSEKKRNKNGKTSEDLPECISSTSLHYMSVIAAYQTQISEYEKSIDGYKKSIDGYKKSTEEYEKSIDGYKKSIDGYKKSIDGSKKSIDGYKKSIDGYEKTIDLYEKSNRQYERWAGICKKSATNSNKEISVLKTVIASNDRANKDLQAELAEIKTAEQERMKYLTELGYRLEEMGIDEDELLQKCGLLPRPKKLDVETRGSGPSGLC
jgi:uncharacterized coiled-coil DUF342 family protein